MKSDYTYKFRIFPAEAQSTLLNKHFGSIRWVYNHFLDRRNNFYLNAKEKQLAKKSLNYLDDAKHLTELKQQPETEWLYECNAQSLQHALKHLDGAFNRFYKKLGGFPKFKSRRSKQSFRVPQTVEIKNGKLYFTKFMDGIAYDQHREVEGEIQNATIVRNPAGQYFACIGVTRDIQPKPKTDKTIGIDLGIKTLVVGSDGTTYPNIKPYRNLEKLIAQRTKAFERTKRVKTDQIDSDGKNIVKDSKGRTRARLYLAKVYNRATNIRSNHLHQISSKIVNENQVIVMEDLNVAGMMKNRKLSKSIWDCSWSELARQIIYKAKWYGREVIKIDRFYPSSKTCGDEGESAGCGYINSGLTLADREWTCPRCGLKHDRDRNAANNILKQGLNLTNQNRSGTTGLAECLGVRPATQKVVGSRLARKSGCSKGDGSPLSETQPSLAAG